MTTIAEDVRAAARWIDDSSGEPTEIGDGLRAHADLLERIEREMRDWEGYAEWLTLTPQVQKWADAIETGSLE